MASSSSEPAQQPNTNEENVYLEEKSIDFVYPKLSLQVDFETFRKTDEQWKKFIKWYNQPRKGEHPSDIGYNKERFVVLQWPRDPKGPPMKTTPEGKHTGNGCRIWGATLYDFYRIYRVPDCPNLSCISSGSRLAAWVKEIGELDFAKDQLKQAELEEEPYRILPFDICDYMQVLEEQVWKGRVGKSIKVDRTITEPTGRFLCPPSEYPAPWPLRPFSTPTMRYQKYLPIACLPRKLIVHDPWHTLEVTSVEARKYRGVGGKAPQVDPRTCKWGEETKDITRTYHLKLNADGIRQTKSMRAISEKPLPEDFTVCPEAHLYITPRRRIGSGHHSFVYQVELELPRDMYVPPTPCLECAKEQFLKDKREHWEYLGEKESPFNKKADNDLHLQQMYSLVYKNRAPFEEKDREDTRFQALRYLNFTQDCQHKPNKVPSPPSQKVSVTAKLSIPDDDVENHMEHLRNEAAIYQSFPSHMYEHWNGYNVIAPIREPVPVGAVAPMFYGFYVPDVDNEPIKNGQFMSPILLLEHCGVSVTLDKLTMDQKQECFSLLKRLHIAGYTHNSVYERNFMVQNGPLQLSPFQRSAAHPRFRLIDFGRTEKYKNWMDTVQEYNTANTNLQLEMY